MYSECMNAMENLWVQFKIQSPFCQLLYSILTLISYGCIRRPHPDEILSDDASDDDSILNINLTNNSTCNVRQRTSGEDSNVETSQGSDNNQGEYRRRPLGSFIDSNACTICTQAHANVLQVANGHANGVAAALGHNNRSRWLNQNIESIFQIMVVGCQTINGNCSKYFFLSNASSRCNEMMMMALVVATKMMDVTGKLEALLRQFSPQRRGKNNGSWRLNHGWKL